jgi:alpha-glucosidase
VASEEKDADSILSFYKQLLKLRRSNKELRDGTYVPVNQNDQNVLSYLRVREDQAVLVSLNMSASPQKVNYELKKNGFASAKPLLTSGKSSSSGDFVSLDAYGVFIGQLMR